MNYRYDRHGNPISILGFGCMRFERKGSGIDFEKAEAQIMRAFELGVNYFDTLSANLLAAICLQQMLRISLSPLVLGVLEIGTIVFLACSAGFALAFNGRIGLEEGAESVANQGAE